MKIQITLLTFVGFLALAEAVAAEQPSDSHVKDQDFRSLRSRAARARAENVRAVDLGSSEGVSPAITSLQDVLSSYSLFAVVPITTETVVENDHNILTWYKLRIVERVAVGVPSGLVPMFGDLGADIQPKDQTTAPDELFLLRQGGSTVIDGVSFTQSLVNFPPLITGKTYVCVLDLSPDGRLAMAPLSGMGIYELIDNDLLKPLSRPDHALSKDLRELHVNSLAKVRQVAAKAYR